MGQRLNLYLRPAVAALSIHVIIDVICSNRSLPHVPVKCTSEFLILL